MPAKPGCFLGLSVARYFAHVFRRGEPFMQMLFLPVDADFNLVEMTEEEAAEREMRSRRIHASRETLGKDSTWTSSTKTVFDGTYRRMLGAARSEAKKESD